MKLVWEIFEPSRDKSQDQFEKEAKTNSRKKARPISRKKKQNQFEKEAKRPIRKKRQDQFREKKQNQFEKKNRIQSEFNPNSKI
jgi:hypothetical protein